MTSKTAIRYARVRRGAKSWELHLFHEGLTVGAFGYRSHDAALAAALVWTHLA